MGDRRAERQGGEGQSLIGRGGLDPFSPHLQIFYRARLLPERGVRKNIAANLFLYKSSTYGREGAGNRPFRRLFAVAVFRLIWTWSQAVRARMAD